MEKRPKVLFFDVNETLLDISKLKEKIGKALNGNTDLLPLWFSKMLYYSSVETLTGTYHDFGVIGAAALQMLAANENIELSKEEAENAIIPTLGSLPPHPEVKEALQKMKEAGFTMLALTNSSSSGLKTQFKNAGLNQFFDDCLSIEEIGKFKPSKEVYTWAAEKMNISPQQAMLIAAHGWDIAGALGAGWRAAFVKRPGKQLYPLAPQPEINEPSLIEIAHKLLALPKSHKEI